MNTRYIHIALLLAVPLLMACSSDDGSPAAEKQPIRLTGSIADATQSETRAATTLYNAFYGGEQIDVSIYKGTTVNASNVIVKENNVYTINATTGVMSYTSGLEPYFPMTANGQVTIRASYPSNPTEATVSVTVLADQTSDNNYKAGELLWASKDATRTTGTTPVDLTFHHRMAKIVVNLTSRNGVPILPATVKLLQFMPTATLTKADGTVVASGTPIDIVMSTNGAAMVPPQTIAANTPIFEIVSAQGDIAQYKSPTALQFKPDYVYTYDVQVDMREIIIKTSITPWADVDEDNDVFTGNVEGEVWS